MVLIVKTTRLNSSQVTHQKKKLDTKKWINNQTSIRDNSQAFFWKLHLFLYIGSMTWTHIHMVVKASNCSTGPHHLEKQTLPPPIVTQVNFKFGLQLSNIKFVWSSLKETSIFANLAIVKTLSQGKASGIGVRVERGHIIYLNQLYNHFFLPKKRKKKN